jgi:hypothetical protein
LGRSRLQLCNGTPAWLKIALTGQSGRRLTGGPERLLDIGVWVRHVTGVKKGRYGLAGCGKAGEIRPGGMRMMSA